MAKIHFRAKVETVRYVGNAHPPYSFVKIPALDRKHCDMNGFRSHPKYGPWANSDMFPAMLKRIRRDIAGDAGIIKLDSIPANVAIDDSGFLATVTIEV